MKGLKDTTSLAFLLSPSVLWVLLSTTNVVHGFSMVHNNIPNLNLRQSISPSLSVLRSVPNDDEEEEELMDALSPEDVQWSLFNKYHARGNWRGSWTTYDYMGDVQDVTVASVNLKADEEKDIVTHEHEIVMGSVKSDCETCFDSMETKVFPVTTYTKDSLGGRHRCASCAMVSGPSLLRSGAMSTELILAFGDGRVRVTFQHAPVWEDNGDDENPAQMNGPPDGLKLFRIIVAKEALRDEPPLSAQQEVAVTPGNPKFFRPVPPFKWHNKWSGTSWTWGPQSGDRGWSIEEMDDADSWHGRPTGDNENVWNLRLPGILLQCPRVLLPNQVDFCRLAWLPEDESEEDNIDAKLLRVEAAVIALEPVIDEEKDLLVGFMPPKLTNLRCDVMTKTGELENASMLEQLKKLDELKEKESKKKEEQTDDDDDDLKSKVATDEEQIPSNTLEVIKEAMKDTTIEEKSDASMKEKSSEVKSKKNSDGNDDLRNMLQL